MKLIDGRVVAEKVYADLRKEIAQLKTRGVTPGLAVVLVGDNPASRAYVRSQGQNVSRTRITFREAGVAGVDDAG